MRNHVVLPSEELVIISPSPANENSYLYFVLHQFISSKPPLHFVFFERIIYKKQNSSCSSVG